MIDSETPEKTYRIKRRRRWDAISEDIRAKGRRTGHFYHELLRRYYRSLVPPGLTVLELGCGHGDLLSALKPKQGVGVDFSITMITEARRKHPHLDFVCADAHRPAFKTTFDVIILSDLVNDLWDVQSVLSGTAAFAHPGTRLIINFFNNMWRLPFSLARRYHFAADLLEQNWLYPADIANLLHLSGYDPIRAEPKILFPAACPLLEPAANRFLVKFPPFQWFSVTNFITARPAPFSPINKQSSPPTVSVVIPARNEAGNIENLLRRTDIPGHSTELIFVEGDSTDNTYETIQDAVARFPEKNCRLIRQPAKGKADAVRAGFREASGEILIILDADLSVPPENLPRFVQALVSQKGEFINGVRLVYPRQEQSMRFLNMVFNKIFSLIMSWLLGQSVKDTLCGTKALWKKDYKIMRKKTNGLTQMDPFGDFELLLSAAANNLKIVDLPVRYRKREYGKTNIKRWFHGWHLLKMVLLAAEKIKFK